MGICMSTQVPVYSAEKHFTDHTALNYNVVCNGSHSLNSHFGKYPKMGLAHEDDCLE